jgi:hypothetical protein
VQTFLHQEQGAIFVADFGSSNKRMRPCGNDCAPLNCTAMLDTTTAAVSHPGFFALACRLPVAAQFQYMGAKPPKRELRVVPLTRAQDNYVSGPDSVRFLMRDGSHEVLCRISCETLSDLAREELVGMREAVEVFEACRSEIERAAGDKYDRSIRHDYEMVTVTADDLALTKALQSILSDNKVREGRDEGLLRMLNAPAKRKPKPAPKKK